jgi:hypothetical protein
MKPALKSDLKSGKSKANLWESISRLMAVFVGYQKRKAGNPRPNQGVEAARLHDREGLSWTKVADVLCKQPHKHKNGKGCSENFRNQRNHFWAKHKAYVKKLTAEAI